MNESTDPSLLARAEAEPERAWLDLSGAQRAIWLDLRWQADPLAYQLKSRVRLQGGLDAETVRQSISLLMARHDALRLRVDDREPRQWLAESATIPLQVHRLEVEDVEAAVQRIFDEPLPLGDAPLFRFDLLRLGPQEWLLLTRVHHLIADASTISIIQALWLEIFQALHEERVVELAATTSFVGTLEGDRRYRESSQHAADLAYWRNRFIDAPEPLFVPRRDARSQPLRWSLQGEPLARWRSACAKVKVTEQRALLAVLAVALARRQGRGDFAIGLALHGRDFSTRGLVGMVAGVLPVRCRIDVEQSLTGAVQALATGLDADFRHQRLPLDELGRAVGIVARGQSRLCDVTMSYQQAEAPLQEMMIGDARVVVEPVPLVEMSPLALYARETAKGPAGTDRLDLTLASAAGFLDDAECLSLAAALQQVMALFSQPATAWLDDIDVLASTERERVVRTWNDVRIDVPTQSLPDAFRQQARATPEALALVDGDESITYTELDAASDAMAGRIAAAVHGDEPVVAVALERSAATVVALLAILKAGCVYLPLDLAYPSQRLQFMLDDARAQLLIAEPDCGLTGVPLLGDGPSAALPVVLPAQLAYVIYTSGSTGQPKPVGVTHAAALNLAHARLVHDPIGVGDRVLAAISVGFDVSIGQLLLPLLSGAAVVIAPALRSLDARAFWALLARHRVSHINSVPSFFDAMVDALVDALVDEPDRYAGLKRLMLGGEILSPALARKLQASLPGTQIVNMYGPTETCIDATAYPVPQGDLPSTLPIGRPLPNYQTYVLDAQWSPAAIGVAGELFIGGDGLARGYLGRAALTAERFVANPFGVPGSRLYRTGDRARWNADGTLEFLGRNDAQVKIRGHRIETGEIEAALLAIDGITRAAVIARPDRAGQSQLVAYLVGRETPSDALRQHLSQGLPDYMLPAAYAWLGALPLTTNGKLDQRALPTPVIESSVALHVEPVNALEARIAAAFGAVLGLDRVSRHANFFELGGHSLLATRLASLLRQQHGIELPLRELFDAPTVAAIALRVSQPERPSVTRIVPRAHEAAHTEGLALSFAQERLWFLQRLAPASGAYNVPMALRIAGDLDVAALGGAMNRVVVHQESLRTRFELRDGRPVQIVEPLFTPMIEQLDLSHLTVFDQEAALAAAMRRAAGDAFDLNGAPPWRMTVLQLASNQHVVLLCLHHIVCDGWSMGVLVRDLAAAYGGRALPLLPIQYADYALWQREHLQGAELQRLGNYWREQLEGAPGRTDLPLDRPRRATRDPVAGWVPLSVPASLAEAIDRQSRAAGVTPFMLLMASFQVLLAHASGQRDVVIGTTIANRVHAEVEPLIGFFVNTLALRAQIGDGQRFSELLAQSRETLLGAYAHQQLPFERLVEVLRPERQVGLHPIFQVLFVLDDTPKESLVLGALRVEPLAIPAATPKFDLTLSLAPTTDGIGWSGGFEYAADVFDAASIETLARRWLAVLHQIVADPQRSIEDIDYLASTEREQVVHTWNDARIDVPTQSLPDAFRQQARATPEALALVDGDESITYTELDAASDAMAGRIAAAVHGDEPVVAVALERSASTVVALLAILKAGCVYLPLDLAYPGQRLQFMLDDARAQLLIAEPDCGLTGVPLLGDAPSAALPVVLPAQLAYVIYTSGSTGQPKPVGVTHAAALNLAHARLVHDPIGVGDRVLAAISVGFDVSIGQLLLPLLSGAAIVIAPALRSLDARAFWALLAQHQVSHINSVPSFFDAMVDALADEPDRYAGLKRLMLGGEILSPALACKLQASLPGTQIVNMYGPTETCIDATAYPVPQGDLPSTLPIGRPLPNYQTYVLDAQWSPAAIGVAGELFIGGDGLARGYLGRAALTAERFVANPFGVPGSRLYRTGDRARWNADGTLEFLGRNDAQVKIRGHRIETGEIEAALLAIDGITQAAVIARPDAAGQAQLVAYLVGRETTSDALRHHLSQGLPDYMLPAAYAWLAALPLTPNGKLDHRALPVPAVESSATVHAEPADPLEAEIAQAFEVVLGVARVGRHASFFELGGHSLLAVSLVDRLQRAGHAIDLAGFFASPNPAALAEAINRVGTAALAQAEPVPPNLIAAGATTLTPAMLPLVDLDPKQIERIVDAVPGGAANIQDIYPLAPLQEGILFHHLLDTTGDAYLMPLLMSFETRAQLDGFIDALQHVIDRHDILRTAMSWDGLPAPVQVVWRHASLPVDDVDSTGVDDVAAMLQQRYDPRRHRLDVRNAPLLHAARAEDAPHRRWLLLLRLHHLTLDHSSLDIVMQEIALIGRGMGATLPPALPFRDVVARSRNAADQATHAAFFNAMLADVDEATAPFGLLDVQGEDADVREARLPLEPRLAERLRLAARRHGVGPASLMHLAWALLLGHVAERDDVVFGTVMSGRSRSGGTADRTLGMFINTLPLRVTLRGASLQQALQATHQRLAQLMQHEHASLSLAQRCSGVTAPTPLFSSLLNYRYSQRGAGSAITHAWPGLTMLAAQERTNYPVALAVDDYADGGFDLTAHALAEAGPAHLCALMHEMLRAMLAAFEADAHTPCLVVPLLPPEDRTIIDAWNDTRIEVVSTGLPDAFRQQARRTPDALAVVDGDESITYTELDAASDAMAGRIAAAVHGDEPVVAVALERSAATVVALLAILKAGCVYLPLDLAYPSQRLQFMLDDARAQLLIAEPDCGLTGVPLLGDGPSAALPVVLPAQLAYVIYTSGSTGQPKPVGVTHAAALNLAHARLVHDPIGVGDRVLAAISVGFDVSIGQLLLPLLSGAAVVIAPALRSLDARAFWALLARHRVSHINSVPSFFDAMVDALVDALVDEPDRYAGLKRLMLGGEILSPALARKLQASLPGTQIVNMYGPTETCIDATAYPVPQGDLPSTLPIGRPLPNYQTYVLDAQWSPAAIGVAGELFIGGDGLARGYLGRAALTAERFVANPFGVPGSRLYRTGDRARWNADGTLEFLGRNDAQVKIRGHRIETGEIEAALLAIDGITQAAVIARPDAAGQAQLVAYLVGREMPDDALRRQLAQHLPDPMLPAACLWLDALPLTPNGKLDTRSLPTPRLQSRDAARPYIAPRNALELQLQTVWQTALSLPTIGVDDNFFDLGGNSLLAIRLHAACNAALGATLPLRALLTRPTIAAMALSMHDKADPRRPSTTPQVVALRSDGARTPLFCIHPQGGSVFCYVDMARLLPADVPVYGLQAAGLEVDEQPLDSIEAMAASYWAQIRIIQPTGPYRIAGYSSGGLIAYEMAAQALARGTSLDCLVLLDAPVPQDVDALDAEPLRAEVFADAAKLVDASATPRSTIELVALLRQHGAVAPDFSEADGERLVEVAFQTLRAARRYRGHAEALTHIGAVLQVRAMRREGALPDWSTRFESALITHDLDCDHLQLMTAAQAAPLAAAIDPLLVH